MNTKYLSKVLITISVAALFIVPMTFVILQTSSNQVKKAEAYNPYTTYNPYVNTEYYYGTNGSGQYYNSTFDQPFQNQIDYTDPYDSYNTFYDASGNAVAVSDFNQTVFDPNGNYSYSKEYQIDPNCNYYWSNNCSNFPLTPESNYSVYDNYLEKSIFGSPSTNYQDPFIIDVPTPNSPNYYNPYRENIQDPTKTWGYPDQDFDFDPGTFIS